MVKNDDALPVTPHGNGENIESFDFDQADFLMLVHAMAIARNTAMMCGGPDAARRFEHYRQTFEAKLPDGARLFQREEQLAEIIYAVRGTGTWSHLHKKSHSWSETGETVIRVGKKGWRVSYNSSDADHEKIIQVIRQLAPMSATDAQWEAPAEVDAST